MAALAVTFAVALWDFWLCQSGKETVSAWSLRVGRDHWQVPFAWGLALGTAAFTLLFHLFMPAYGESPAHWGLLGALTGLAVALALTYLFFAQSGL